MSLPKIAGTSPIVIDAEKDKNYAWCTCGLSEKKHLCDGKHSGSEYSPLIFKEEEERKIALCTCKQTSNPPYCDGAHARV